MSLVKTTQPSISTLNSDSEHSVDDVKSDQRETTPSEYDRDLTRMKNWADSRLSGDNLVIEEGQPQVAKCYILILFLFLPHFIILFLATGNQILVLKNGKSSIARQGA